MKNAFAKVLSFAVVVTVGLSANAATITVDNIPAFLTAVSNNYAEIILKPGVYDFTGVPVSRPNSDTDKRTAYILVTSGITIRGENTKHWSEKTREEETVIKGDGATRLVYGYGGGGRRAKLLHITFEDGNAWNCPQSSDGKYGGAIYYMGPSNGFVTNCVFRNCSAKRGGGTHCVSSYDCLYENCTTGNDTSGYGGGAYGNGSSSYTDAVTNRYAACIFSGCSAYQGGGLYANEMRMLGNRKTGGYVDKCVFTNNTAINIGGAIYGYKVDSITDCRFVDNHAGTGTGGAFHLYTACNGVASNCTFVGNSSRLGGAVGKCDYIYDSVFTDNWTTNNGVTKEIGGGGAIANALGMFGCTFSNNVAYVLSTSTVGGGAAYNCNGTNCRFENNRSTYQGGAVYYYNKGAYTNCQFVGNISTNHGGAAFYGTYVNCEFDGNTSTGTGNGGAGYGVKCYDCKIVNNKVLSARAGGVSQSTCFDCVFSNNCCSSSARGGAAAWTDCTRCKFYGIGDVSIGCYADCEFDGIVANNGKQPFVFDSLANSGGSIYITNCLIHNCNVAQIFHCDGHTMEAVNCTVVDNKLKKFGSDNALVAVCNLGVAYNPAGNHVSTNRLINCLFANNKGSNGAPMDLSVWADVKETDEGPLCTNELYNCMYEEGTSFTGGLVKKDCFQGKARFNKGSRSDQPYYALRYMSDAKNKGMNFSWMETGKDMAGKPRIFDDGVNIVDIGCYECDMLPLGLILKFQ